MSYESWLGQVHEQNEEICMAAVKQDGTALRMAKDKFKTPVLCMTAVKQNGDALYYVPKEKRTFEICIVAVGTKGKALKHVPDTFTPEEYDRICLAAIENDKESFGLIQPGLCTNYSAICLAAVQKDPNMIKCIVSKYQTEEMGLIAIRKSGILLKYVAARLQSLQMLTEAVNQNIEARAYISEQNIRYLLSFVQDPARF